MSYEWRDLTGFVIDGKYPLVEFLGEVGDNGVFATEPVDSRPAIVRLAPSGNPESARFLPQWRDVALLSHPHIAQTFAAGATNANGLAVVYTVTERPDDSLAMAVEKRALNAEEAQSVTTSVLGALDYLHSRGYAHCAVSPDNIVAMGDVVKLAPWTIARAEGDEIRQDRIAAGQTIVEILTQKRPAEGAAVPAGLPPRLAATATALLNGASPKEAEATPVTKRFRLHTGAVIAASVGVLALVIGVRALQSDDARPQRQQPQKQTVASIGRDVTSSSEPSSRERIVASAPATSQRGPWTVVAAIYKDRDLAAKRAERMQERFKQWQPEVIGSGHRYMVVLGFAESRKEADAIRTKARRAGMPSDVYVTRLRR